MYFPLLALATVVQAVNVFSNPWRAPSAPGIRPCPVGSSNIEKCISNSLNTYIPMLAQGWGDELPPLDPLMLPSIETGYDDGNVTLSLRLKNIVIVGLSSTKVYSVRKMYRIAIVEHYFVYKNDYITFFVPTHSNGDIPFSNNSHSSRSDLWTDEATFTRAKSLEEGKLELMCKTRVISATGMYASEGAVITFPLHGSGPFNLTLGDLTSHFIIHLEGVKNHIRTSEMRLNVMPAQIDAQAGGSLDEDNSLGDALNVYLSENSFELYELVRPRLVKYFSEMFKSMVNSLLEKTPTSAIFPNLDLNK